MICVKIGKLSYLKSFPFDISCSGRRNLVISLTGVINHMRPSAQKAS